MKLMENGENSFNDLEKVKQEIFSRNYNEFGTDIPKVEPKPYTITGEAYNRKEKTEEECVEDLYSEKPTPTQRKSNRWSIKDEIELVAYYQAGMTIEQLAKLFIKNEDAIKGKLAQKGFIV